MRATTFRLVVTATAVLATALAAAAAADTIYLKNGRRIRSEEVRIDGDSVIFLQHGGYQTLPLSLVDRIEEDDNVSPGSEPAVAPVGNGSAAAPVGSDPTRPTTASPGSGIDLGDLSSILSGSTGGIDGGQALQILQALGNGSAAGGGLESLAPLLGALGGGGALGAMANDVDKVQVVLPAVTRLATALFAPEYSADAADAAAADLMRALERVGVSRAEIRDRARQLGVPEEIIDRLRVP